MRSEQNGSQLVLGDKLRPSHTRLAHAAATHLRSQHLRQCGQEDGRAIGTSATPRAASGDAALSHAVRIKSESSQSRASDCTNHRQASAMDLQPTAASGGPSWQRPSTRAARPRLPTRRAQGAFIAFMLLGSMAFPAAILEPGGAGEDWQEDCGRWRAAIYRPALPPPNHHHVKQHVGPRSPSKP